MKQNILRSVTILFLVFTTTNVWAESSVWVVSTPQSTLYLAGSCHVLRASDHPLPSEFHKAYANSSKIIFEAPPSEMEIPEYLQKLMQAAVYNDGTTLKEHLSSRAYTKAESFCKEKNYPFLQYQSFRPWMLAMMLTMQEMARLGVESGNGVDTYFNTKALKDGKTISGLETVDQQIGFLTAMDESMDNQQIVETIDELKELETKLPDIINAWRKGDEAGIENFSLKELRDYPKLYLTLIVERNRQWVKAIERQLNESQNTMVIVGVAHLAGKDSVVDLLRKRGYKVEKLR